MTGAVKAQSAAERSNIVVEKSALIIVLLLMVSDSFCLSAEKVLRKRPIFTNFGISSHISAQMGAYLVYTAAMEPLI